MSNHSKDPFFEREKEKYTSPIPSREFILDILKELGCPVARKKLETLCHIITESDSKALGYRLKAMIRDAQLMLDRRGRYCLLDRLTIICGRIIGHADGFGFLVPEEGGNDWFISPAEMRGVMHGDRVLARHAGQDHRGRDMGVIHEVLERHNKTVVGTLLKEHEVYYLKPDSKHLPNAIYLPSEWMKPEKETTSLPKPGSIVLVEIVDFPTKQFQAIGRITQVLGDPMAPGMEINVAIHAHQLPVEWSEDTLEEMAHFVPDMPLSQDDKKKTSSKNTMGDHSQPTWNERTDLRNLPFVTIDGEDARDFDDAVYVEPKKRSNGAWRLWVAIADVSHYVQPNTALDEDAILRGNSVYFPGRVLPMLPEILSDELCSLKPHVDRLCMVCEMSITPQGTLDRFRFYRAVIHSHARMTYTEVAALLEEDKKLKTHQNPTETPHPRLKELQNLFALYQILVATRHERGALDFETTETRIIFDENKKIQAICPTVRNDAHRIIEEAMLMANVAAARFLQQHKIPGLFRVHPEPSEEKMRNLRDFLEELNVPFTGAEKPTVQDLSKALKAIENRTDKHLIQTVMLRSMNQAKYSDENVGHFGLAYPYYTHFTSPIRRYADLLTHRAIGWILDHREVAEYTYTTKRIHQLGEHCSETERRADEATREVTAWLKCEFLQDKLDQEFDGHISSVTSFGIFVELDDIYVEGLVHVTSLNNDYYRYEAARHHLIGERTHTIYRLGDRIRVRVARVNLDDRKIDFDLVTPSTDTQQR